MKYRRKLRVGTNLTAENIRRSPAAIANNFRRNLTAQRLLLSYRKHLERNPIHFITSPSFLLLSFLSCIFHGINYMIYIIP